MSHVVWPKQSDQQQQQQDQPKQSDQQQQQQQDQPKPSDQQQQQQQLQKPEIDTSSIENPAPPPPTLSVEQILALAANHQNNLQKKFNGQF
ncbi:unnamed protein product [Ambrosiozyma monospora]|uniref:Unnamed protein product n=1 Tax=Ambrosiozyma monospora TaxID=43982 RepID=A0A9W6Z3K9_AMBMO|nr:unnamed protein product [Ambrosiozyma monospora]